MIRASEIRQQIGDLWGEYIDRYPRRFSVVRADAPDTWTLVLRTFEPMPTRLSTLFGEWLYELRAALDGGQGRQIDSELLAHIWPTHHANVHFYGTHTIDIDGELAKLDTDGYRPLRTSVAAPGTLP